MPSVNNKSYPITLKIKYPDPFNEQNFRIQNFIREDRPSLAHFLIGKEGIFTCEFDQELLNFFDNYQDINLGSLEIIVEILKDNGDKDVYKLYVNDIQRRANGQHKLILIGDAVPNIIVDKQKEEAKKLVVQKLKEIESSKKKAQELLKRDPSLIRFSLEE